jgi:uncharacterized protein (DUF2147 family)
MRRFGLAAVAVLMSTAAYAGEVHEFRIGGGTVRIEMRDCKGGSCPWVTWNEKSSRKSKKAKEEESTPVETTTAPAPAPAVAAAPPPPPTPAPVATPAPAPRNDVVIARAPSTGEPAPAPPLPTESNRAPVSAPAADGAPMWKEEPRQQLALRAPEPPPVAKTEPALAPVKAAKPVGPIGEWIVEDGEGRVMVEECGANLCGKVSHAKNPNDTDKNNPDPALRKRSVIGLPVLIDMKPKGDRWEGKVYNAKDGKTYTAKISMKNPNTMRIEGCIMGGMLCGGQNWKRAQ